MSVTPVTSQLVVTQGDPAGIGPELLLRLGAADLLHAGDIVVADPAPLRALADSLGDWAVRGLTALEPLLDTALASPFGQVSALVRGVDLVLADPARRRWSPRRSTRRAVATRASSSRATPSTWPRARASTTSPC